MDKKPAADQVERFKETARALGCDENEAAFDEKLRRVAAHKPKDISRVSSPPAKRMQKKP